EPAGILGVDYGTSGEDHDSVFFFEGCRQFSPMQQISANGMSPTHVAPFIAKRVVLKEQVIFAIEVNQAVGIVGPMLAWREVKLRAKGLIVSRWNISAETTRDRHGG